MKKIIWLLILIPFFITGCYDYKEVSKLALVTTIGIDYQDDEFTLTYEILTGNNYDEEAGEIKPYTINSKGKTIAEAASKAALKIAGYPDFYHLKCVIISKDVEGQAQDDVLDYFVRAPGMSNEFLFVVADNCEAKEILKIKNGNKLTIADYVTDLIQKSTFTFDATYENYFEQVLQNHLKYGQDVVMANLKKDDDKIVVNGLSLYKDSKYKGTLDLEQSALLTALIQGKTNFLLKKEYDDKDFIVNAYKTKVKYDYLSDNKIKIKLVIEAEIKLNGPDFNLSKDDIYQKLNKDFAKVAKTKAENLFNTLQEKNVDATGITSNYYKKKRKKKDNLFKDSKLEIEVNMKINRNGLTYEVPYE